MNVLFEPYKIKNVELPNRFVRSATFDGYADVDGLVTDDQLNLFSELAIGGVGLIITGIMSVCSSGQHKLGLNSIAEDSYIDSLKRLTSIVHNKGSKIAVQLFHAGKRSADFQKLKGKLALAPSLIEGESSLVNNYRALEEDEIWDIIQSFGDAAKRAKEAGFDAVQVQSAHAWLLSQFLSPFANRRQDKWGGTLENRLRIHKEIYSDMRKKVGKDFPIIIKIGVQDGFTGGLEFTEGQRAAKILAQYGYNALEISIGLRGEIFEGTEARANIDTITREAYFRDWCKHVKYQVTVPTIMIGGLRSFELIQEIVSKGEADLIALCRPLIREPGLINRWKSGDHTKAKCTSCNKCLEALIREESLHCINVEDN